MFVKHIIVFLVLVFILLSSSKAQDVEMSQYTFTLDLRKVSNQDGVTSYTSKNSQDYPEYETEEIVSTGPLQETDELEEVSVSEAKTESMSAVLSAARKVGGIIKTFIIKGLKAFKIKAGVLKGFIISQGKALPKKFVKYLKDYVKKLKNMPGKAKKLIKNIKKDGIFKVVKAHRAKNLNKVKALGSYTKITASGGKIVKFSAKRLIKEFTKQFMVAYGRKVAMGLGKKLAMEYAKFTYNTVVNHETTEQKKKFNKLEAIKKYFVAAQFCWKQTWGAGIGWIPSSCPRSHPIKGRVFVNHLCYRNCRHGYEKVRGGCATKCPKYFWTHRSYCQQNKTWYYAWASGGKCSRREGFHMHRWKRGICVRPNRKISRRFYRDPQVNRVKYKICPRGQNKQGGLCYNNCPRGYTKGGPYCWQTCPRDLPNTCGAMCTKTPSACAKKIAGLVFNGVSAAVNAAVGNYASAALDIASTVQELASIPKCPVDPRGKPPKIPKHYRKCYSKTLVGGVRVTLCCVDGNCSLKSMKFPNHHKLTNKTLFHVQRTHSRWSCRYFTKCKVYRRCIQYRIRSVRRSSKYVRSRGRWRKIIRWKRIKECKRYSRLYKRCRRYRNCRKIYYTLPARKHCHVYRKCRRTRKCLRYGYQRRGWYRKRVCKRYSRFQRKCTRYTRCK